MSPTIIAALMVSDGVASPATVTASPASLSNDAVAPPPVLSPLSQAWDRDLFRDASDAFFKTTPFPSFDTAPDPCSNCGHAREDTFGFPSASTARAHKSGGSSVISRLSPSPTNRSRRMLPSSAKTQRSADAETQWNAPTISATVHAHRQGM